MKPHFEAEFFRGNRARLQALFVGTAPIVLTANGLLQWSTDNPYPFKQDGNFWYLTGIDQPNVLLVMDKGKEYLIIPQLSPAREAFDGAIDPAGLSKISGIEEVLVEKEGWKRLETRLKRVRNIAVLSPPPRYVEALGMYTNPARRKLIKDIKNINLTSTFLDLGPAMKRLRTTKQPVEIEAITQAVNITIKSLRAIRRKFEKQRYGSEFEVELDLGREFRARGAMGHSFPPIIAAGGKASTIHTFDNRAKIIPDGPLLVDTGAEYDHYAADITRTWALNPSKRFSAVHNSVLEVADFALSLIKPGIALRDYETQVEKFMGEKLRELSLIKSIGHDSVRKYYPTMTSHFLGIDIHDVGDYERPLEPGTVLTVEPGIYIPEEGIGVRIEDDVVVTDNGIKILSDSLPRGIA